MTEPIRVAQAVSVAEAGAAATAGSEPPAGAGAAAGAVAADVPAGDVPAVDVPAPTLPAPAFQLPAPFPSFRMPSRPAMGALIAGIVVFVLAAMAAETLTLFFLGIVVVYLIDPPISWMARHRVPRWAGTLVMLAILGGARGSRRPPPPEETSPGAGRRSVTQGVAPRSRRIARTG